MNSEWSKLRAFNGDIKNGFEELVCQLARAEQIPNKSKFIRVAAPDAGVESYCILSDNSEYGWQAKFFSSMDNSQWKQLDNNLNNFWTVLGEKLIIGDSSHRTDYEGRLNISGVVHFDKGQLKHTPYFVEER